MSLAALVGVAALTAALVSAGLGRAERRARASEGGTYRVGWEIELRLDEQLRPDR